jgi:hypothetical protein
VSVGVDDQGRAFSRDAVLIALAHARDQIGFPDDRLQAARSVRPESNGDAGSKTSGTVEPSQSVLGTNPAKPSEGAARGGLSMWKLLGLGALVPFGAVILGWHFLYRTSDVAPVSTSSVRALAAKSVTPSPPSPRAAPRSDTEQVGSVGSPRPDLNRSVAPMTHQLADSEQEIEELKSRQAQILLDNSELDRRLKEAQQLARSNADLIEELKSAQNRMAQDNADLAAQVKASQEQVTNLAAQLDASQAQVAKIAARIKASQDQSARFIEPKQRSQLIEPKQRPQLSTLTPLGADSPKKKLAPKPPLQRAPPQTETPAHTPSHTP